MHCAFLNKIHRGCQSSNKGRQVSYSGLKMKKKTINLNDMSEFLTLWSYSQNLRKEPAQANYNKYTPKAKINTLLKFSLLFSPKLHFFLYFKY